MAQECWNNLATGAGHQIMVEPVITAIAQQIVTPTAIMQLALRGERISSEDKCQAILNEAASRKQEQEKKRKDWENLEKESLQLLREDKKDLDMMQNIAEFNVWTLRRVQWYKNNADGYINRASMEDDMDNSMTQRESRKLAVCSKKIRNKSSAPMLRHVRLYKNKANGYNNRPSMEDNMDNAMTRGESRKLAVWSKKTKNKSSAPMLRHVRLYNNKADGYNNRVSMEEDMDNSMTRGESRKLAVRSKKIKNKSSSPVLRHVRQYKN